MTEPNDWILDVTAVTFEKEVIHRSRSVPVVVDFWASWCQPCKELTPVLEQLAREGDGRFVLAKVDLDQNPELGQALQVQAVPSVFAVIGGRLADGFQGALPRDQLEAFLDRIAPRVASEPSVVEQADALAAAGDTDAAAGLLRDHLREASDDNAARLRLAELRLDQGKTDEARKLVEKLAGDPAFASGLDALRARIELVESSGGIDELRRKAAAAPDDAEARAALGRGLFAVKDHEGALEELLEAIRLDPETVGPEAKKTMLEIFDERGLEDPLANEYRFKLSLELFS